MLKIKFLCSVILQMPEAKVPLNKTVPHFKKNLWSVISAKNLPWTWTATQTKTKILMTLATSTCMLLAPSPSQLKS